MIDKQKKLSSFTPTPENSKVKRGRYVHAEGLHSHAEGTASHAEGLLTHAKGSFSHAEGSKRKQLDIVPIVKEVKRQQVALILMRKVNIQSL